jgi:hypothetical protein
MDMAHSPRLAWERGAATAQPRAPAADRPTARIAIIDPAALGEPSFRARWDMLAR